MIKTKPIFSQIKMKLFMAEGVKTEQRVMHGRSYLVVPATILVEGVHVGNGDVSAILYTKKALATNVDGWNGRPVTIGHPHDDAGELTDPDSPEILERFQIGTLFNSRLDNEGATLKADVWLDIERTESLAREIFQRIQENIDTDVSTDMKIDGQLKFGLFNGEHYEAEATAIHPKGLAILLNIEGACSFRDGCGIRNRACQKSKGCVECTENNKENIKMAEETKKKEEELSADVGVLKGLVVALIGALTPNKEGCGCPKDPEKKKEEKTPPAATMEEFLSTAPEGFKVTLQAGLDAQKTALEAGKTKLKVLATDIMKLDDSWKAEDLAEMNATALTKLKASLEAKTKKVVDYSLLGGDMGAVTVDAEAQALETPGWPKDEKQTTQ